MHRYLVLQLVLLGMAASAFGQPVVPAVERFRGEEAVASEDLGRVLMQELNCVACHVQPGLQGKQAPVLTNVSGRVRAEHLQQFIGRPQETKPGTTMPNVFKGVSEAQREKEVTALVHYLMSLGDVGPPQGHATYGARRRGRLMYNRVGCAACHDGRGEGAAGLKTSTPLGDLDAKYTLPSLAGFLRDPMRARPSGRMPSMVLSEHEAGDIAAYLLREGKEKPGIEYEFFADEWSEFPDFENRTGLRHGLPATLRVSSSGVTDHFDLGLAGRRRYYGMRFTGNLAVDRAGEYTFHVRTTDRMRLWIDGSLLMDQRDERGSNWNSQEVELAAGRHDVQIAYIGREEQPEDEFAERSREREADELCVEWEGPGIERQPLEVAMMNATPDVPLESQTFRVDPKLAAEGRRLFASRGCASCHEVMESGGPVQSEITAPTLAALAGGGCLTGSPGAPDFALDAGQQALLAGYLAGVHDSSIPATLSEPRDLIAHTMLTFNCYACHQRGGVGGVEFSRDEGFQTTEPEMGDEGRLPPLLDGVGAKLKETWLANVIGEGADDRPYMLTRMPSFDAKNIGALAEHFAEADAMEPLASTVLGRAAAKNAGRHLVGAEGVSCITCHAFGRNKAEGMQSIDMTIMTKRLREDWFRRYVRDPQTYRSGTQMPTFWDDSGRSQLTEILDGDSDAQIQAVWTYLSDGAQAKTPAGYGDRFMELIADDEAVIFRNFIEGAGSRAIGVGFPEGINLAFDANDARLALIWQGGFIDAGLHWRERGEGFQPPLGEKVKTLVTGVPLAKLSSASDAWPEGTGKELGIVFTGYRLTPDKRPTFMYRFGNLRVEDSPNPVETASGIELVRDLRFSGSADDGTWFRLARSSKIEEEDGWYVFDGLRMRIETDASAKPVLREQDGAVEVLIPVSASTEITQRFRW